MFKCEAILDRESSADAVDHAIASAKNLYLSCMEAGAGTPGLGLALVNLAIRYQTGAFGDDIGAFNRRVADLLAETRQSNES